MLDKELERRRLDSLYDDLFPICRSITGPGLRESLDIVSEHIPLEIEGVPSGTSVFDWEIPAEWRIYDARLTGPDGKTYANFQKTNLSVVNYSEPVDRRLMLDELDPHLYTNPEVSNATPYVTSYYDRTWGFCLPHDIYEGLPDGEYHAYIDSEFVDGELNYAHATLQGESEREVLLSSYLCHPSLANNELSGPLVLTSLYKRLKQWDERIYTYRFVLCPETIGSLTYLSEHGEHLKSRLAGGIVLTCLGGPNGRLSYKTTRREDALVDEIARNIDEYGAFDFEIRPFTPTEGSDERQYCSPGFNLPVGQMARTVYGEYEGYHNDEDDKEFMGISPLVESAAVIERVLQGFEYADYFENQEPYGEPMLGKRDLYPNVNSPERWVDTDAEVDKPEFLDRILMILNYSDGQHSLVEIANMLNASVLELIPAVEILKRNDLLTRRADR